jgi:hypothetical protein
MKRLAILLLAAAALAATPAAAQTIKSLGFNATNGFIVYGGTNPLTFTNSLQFATNARAATRTNLGLGTAAVEAATAFQPASANLTNLASNNAASLTNFPALLLRTNGSAAGLTNFPTLNQNTTGTASNVTGTVAVANGGTGATNAAAGATALGLGTTNNVTFSNVTSTGTLIIASPTVPAATNSTGVKGQIAFTNNFLYICVASNTWRRIQLGAWE